MTLNAADCAVEDQPVRARLDLVDHLVAGRVAVMVGAGQAAVAPVFGHGGAIGLLARGVIVSYPVSLWRKGIAPVSGPIM